MCSLMSDGGHRLESGQASSPILDVAHMSSPCVYGVRLSGKKLLILYRSEVGSIFVHHSSVDHHPLISICSIILDKTLYTRTSSRMFVVSFVPIFSLSSYSPPNFTNIVNVRNAIVPYRIGKENVRTKDRLTRSFL